MVLRVVCADLPAPPLFWRDDSGQRLGYETEVAREIAKRLGKQCEFVYVNWLDFYPTLEAGKADLLLCGQGISEYRKTLADFTVPYAIFDEAVMVLRDSTVASPADLRGRKVGAIANSVNMALAQTFEGAITVAFAGDSGDVLGDMIQSLRNQEIDAFVDDDVALVPLAAEPDLKIGFMHPSHNAWGAAVKKGNDALRHDVDQALNAMKADGSLQRIWQEEIKILPYPF